MRSTAENCHKKQSAVFGNSYHIRFCAVSGISIHKYLKTYHSILWFISCTSCLLIGAVLEKWSSAFGVSELQYHLTTGDWICSNLLVIVSITLSTRCVQISLAQPLAFPHDKTLQNQRQSENGQCKSKLGSINQFITETLRCAHVIDDRQWSYVFQLNQTHIHALCLVYFFSETSHVILHFFS